MLSHLLTLWCRFFGHPVKQVYLFVTDQGEMAECRVCGRVWKSQW